MGLWQVRHLRWPPSWQKWCPIVVHATDCNCLCPWDTNMPLGHSCTLGMFRIGQCWVACNTKKLVLSLFIQKFVLTTTFERLIAAQCPSHNTFLDHRGWLLFQMTHVGQMIWQPSWKNIIFGPLCHILVLLKDKKLEYLAHKWFYEVCWAAMLNNQDVWHSWDTAERRRELLWQESYAS